LNVRGFLISSVDLRQPCPKQPLHVAIAGLAKHSQVVRHLIARVKLQAV
jgi:hypothetical protein